MSGLTQDFLHDIGIDLDDQMFDLFATHFNETVLDRIVSHIVHDLTPEQVLEVNQMRDAQSEHIWQWLQTNVPNHQEIIKQEVDSMLAEVVRTSEHI